MADFEDNPFADPTTLNPFADPSVQQVSEPPPTTDDYNPFVAEEKKGPEPPKLPPPSAQQPKQKKQTKKSPPQRPKAPLVDPAPPVLQTEPPPSYSPAPVSFQDDELRKREEDIARREKELKDRERNLAKLGSDSRPRNFPPLPKWFPIQPCFYINISEEIPPGERWKLRLLVGLLFTYTFLLFLNVIVCIAGLVVVVGKKDVNYTSTSAIVAVIMSIIWFFLFPVLALFCWFMPAYTAYRKDSSLAYMWYFFIKVIQCVMWIIVGLGPPGFTCGIISGVQVLDASKPVGGMFIVLGFLWLLLVPWGAIMVFLIHRYYRQSGGTLDKAVGEAAKGAASNKAVRDAVKGTVKAGVSAAMTPNAE